MNFPNFGRNRIFVKQRPGFFQLTSSISDLLLEQFCFDYVKSLQLICYCIFYKSIQAHLNFERHWDKSCHCCCSTHRSPTEADKGQNLPPQWHLSCFCLLNINCVYFLYYQWLQRSFWHWFLTFQAIFAFILLSCMTCWDLTSHWTICCFMFLFYHIMKQLW